MAHPEALAAIRAWTRLENARAEFGRALERRYGVTGAQLGILRIIAEHEGVTSPTYANAWCSTRRRWDNWSTAW